MKELINNTELKDLLEVVNTCYGYDYTGYSPSSIKRSIIFFMDTRQIPSILILKKLLLENETLFGEFVRSVSITVTEMFRDPLYYKTLREKIIRRLATYPMIRVWVAGCATGEEAYSIAIMLKEEGLLERSVIYATDINQYSLAIGMQGAYPLKNMQLYTTNYLKAGGLSGFSEYYTAKYDSVLFNNALKQKIVFSSHNLVTDRSFNEFQLVTCRNVLIYFNNELQNKVIDLLYESLCPFGFLSLGNRENLHCYHKKDSFTVIDKKAKIFMKKESINLAAGRQA
jgi:chemotaxis protein methyltransferase CheR